MPIRTDPVDDAARRAHRQLAEVVNDLRAARLAAGLTQTSIARAIGCSGPLISMFERGVVTPSVYQLARWGAAVGIDIPLRTFPAGSPLRDAGQLRLLARFRAVVGDGWVWRTEAPVSRDPRDRRAFDVVPARDAQRIAVEAVMRLTDAQHQTRSVMQKQAVSGVARVVLLLADTRHNRSALREAAPTLSPDLPLGSREVLRFLRAGTLPPANGIVLI